MTLVLAKGSLVTLAGITLSEHARSSFDEPREFIKSDARTVTGTMRRYHIANKRKFSFSWARLPGLDSQTLDGFAGRNSLRDLVDTYFGQAIVMTFKEVDPSNVELNTTLNVFIDDYSEQLEKRWASQLWNISISLVEE